MRTLLAIFAFSLALAVGIVTAEEQEVNVRGQVICDKRSLRNIRVELRERDTFDPDDSLAETHTDKDGFFTLKGTENEYRKIRPYVRVSHNCDVKDRAMCTRITDFDVPEEKVGADKVYDMTFVNLNLRGVSDEETCT